MTYQKHLILVAGGVSALAALMTWVTASANFAAQARMTSVAVVDVSQAFNKCKEQADIQAEVQFAQDELSDTLDKMKKRIAEKKSDMDLYKPGEDAWKQLAEQLSRKIIEIEIEKKLGTQKIIREQIIRYEGLYLKLRDACGEIAMANGYDVVMYREPVKLARTNLEQLSNQIGARKVLWSADDLNITDQVLQVLDNAWGAREQ